jgi:RecB family endonuclease NucS
MERLHLDSVCFDLARTGQVIFHPAKKATEVKHHSGVNFLEQHPNSSFLLVTDEDSLEVLKIKITKPLSTLTMTQSKHSHLFSSSPLCKLELIYIYAI